MALSGLSVSKTPARPGPAAKPANTATAQVIVSEHQLSLAIGKKGQNVRLAAKLSGWKIDIMSETRAAELEQEERLAGTAAEASAEETTGTALRDLPAKEAIALIKECSDEAALNEALVGEERVTVLRAAESRKAELAGE